MNSNPDFEDSDQIVFEQREADLWNSLKEAKIEILMKKLDTAYAALCRLKNTQNYF